MQPEPLLPTPALLAVITCVAGAAALANCAVLAVLFRRSNNGLYSIIAHLSIADLLLLAWSIAPELWSTNSRSWPFGHCGCVLHQGLNVFASTASQYLVVAVSLHSLAVRALEEKASVRSLKRKAHEEDEEMRSSRRSLVTNSDSSTPRTMNVDYRQETMVAVTLPVMFVWFMAASVSVPYFLSAFTVSKDNVAVCTIDSTHRINIRFLLSIFNVFLPIFLLSTACALLVVRFPSRKKRFETHNCESVTALKLSMWLIVVHGLLSLPRNIANAYYDYVDSATEYVIPMKTSHLNDVLVMVFGIANMVATLIRPILCIFMMPHLRKVVFLGSKSQTERISR